MKRVRSVGEGWWKTPASLLAAAAVVLGLVAVVVNLAMASESAATLVVLVSLAGVAALAVGVVAGWPALVVAGTVGTLLGTGVATVDSASAFDLRVAIVVPSIWLAFELAMRSMELRPAVRPGLAPFVEWLGVSVAVAAGSVGVVLVASTAVEATPAGGPAFRVLAVAAVVVVVVAVGIVNLWRRPADGARG
jgi:hypothetical protein